MRVLLIVLIFVGCSIAPNSNEMGRHVYMKKTTQEGGVVEYGEYTHWMLLPFKKLPKEVARELISKRCPSGYVIKEETTERKIMHRWKTVIFSCK